MIENFWQQHKIIILLLCITSIFLLFNLGIEEIWTQEIRWAEICRQMINSGDYLHPYLNGYPYYDKPLLSYWFIIAASHLLGSLSEWSIRFPSAIAGVITTVCIYALGKRLVNDKVGIIASLLLITTYYFIFWARIGNSDMLNVASILLSLVWYFSHKDKPGFFNYCVFFLIIAVGSLCKGLLAATIPLIVILPDIIIQNEWKKHFRFSILLAPIPALIVYLLPFWASQHFGGQQYGESGLVEVFRENILRFVKPFDHQGPIYTYFIYLPIYLLPWTIFFIPALFTLKKDWPRLAPGERWIVWAFLLVFIFFTASGSRRNYYTLPMVPFAILFTACWIERYCSRYEWLKRSFLILMIFSFIAMFLLFDIVKPFHYSSGGLRPFGQLVYQQATAEKPWSDWTVALLNPEDQAPFYVNPAKEINYRLPHRDRHLATQQLMQYWAIINTHPNNMIFLTKYSYAQQIAPYLKNYIKLTPPPYADAKWRNTFDSESPVAFIPINNNNTTK